MRKRTLNILLALILSIIFVGLGIWQLNRANDLQKIKNTRPDLSVVNLEKLIRDDTNACKVIFDFKVGDDTYRVSRSRTKKGASDISLYKRNATEGDKTKNCRQ